VEATIKTLATRDDIAIVKDDLAKAKYDLSNEIGCVRKEIGESKAENIKWMFIFWLGQIAVMLAIVFLFLKK
jgi:hypothetical protein